MRTVALLPLLTTLLSGVSGAATAEEVYTEETPPAYVGELGSDYDLWQDGEGGASCAVSLGDQRSIGGYQLDADEDCAAKLELAGDPQAWFLRDDGQLILVDATRQVLLRLDRLHDGTFKDPRDGDYVNAVLLTPRQDSKD